MQGHAALATGIVVPALPILANYGVLPYNPRIRETCAATAIVRVRTALWASVTEYLGRFAAAFPLVAITAWEALVDRATISTDEFVLIHGGAGGTGQMAIQLARIKGAKIAATVGTAEKAEIIMALGADLAILYRSEDFVKAALEWTEGVGLQVALDNVGPVVLARTFSAMGSYGRVITPMWFGLRDHLKRQADIVRNMISYLANGQIKVRIEESLPLSEVAAAHKRLEAGSMSGKIALDVRS